MRNRGFLSPPAQPHSCAAEEEEEGFEGPSSSPWHRSPAEALALSGQLLLALREQGAPPRTLQGFCPAVLCVDVLFLFPFCKKNTPQNETDPI